MIWVAGNCIPTDLIRLLGDMKDNSTSRQTRSRRTCRVCMIHSLSMLLREGCDPAPNFLALLAEMGYIVIVTRA
jgi:hypothetical protein